MHEEIENLVKQFSFEGEVKNSENLVKKSKFVIAGMGGSAHAALILKTWKPELDIIIHRNYDLPKIEEKDLAERLVILSSYSGNTEETLDAFSKAKEQKLSMAVVTAGGKLLSLAKENNIPYIEIPSGLQPRSALGLSTIAFLKFTGKENELKNLKGLTTSLEGAPLEEEGKKLADKLNNCVPVIYTSDRNYSLAYIWKIKLNETGKVPAFCNVFPELDHNEINGYDVKELNEKLYFIILKDIKDHPRIQKRMEVTEKLYKDRGLKVETIDLKGVDVWHKIFSSLILADWTSYYLAKGNGLDPEQVPIIEELKKLILE